MQQNDDNTKTIEDTTTLANENRLEERKDWFDEHGQPSAKYLQSLAADGSPEAIKKLKAIATDLDVNFGPNSSIEELIGAIRSATRSDPNTTT